MGTGLALTQKKPLNYKCPQCEKCRFKSISAVRQHFFAVLHTGKLQCSKCDKSFQSVLSLIDHYQCHERRIAAAQTKSKRVTDTQQTEGSAALNPQLYMTRKVMFEHLRAQCHSSARLEAEGYFLGVKSMTKSRATKSSIPDNKFLAAPKLVFPPTKRLAIVIDCEMVEVANGRQTLAFLSAIDFFTGEILINNLVKPTEKVINWRTNVSGVSPALMSRACATGEAIRSWQTARQKLWEFMDNYTIIIGHSLQYDLEVLGVLHFDIVDSSILTAEAVFPPNTPTERPKRTWGLKTLAKEFLNREIQRGNSGHSALEDVIATRDVVFWCMCNPQLLQGWAEKNRIEEQKRTEANKKKNSKKKKRGGKEPVGKQKRLDDDRDRYHEIPLEYPSDLTGSEDYVYCT